MPKDKPAQSIKISGGQVPGQVGVAGGNAVFIQQGNQTASTEKTLTPTEVTERLTQIERLL